MINIQAYQISEQINIKQIKQNYKQDYYFSSSIELFYFNNSDNSAIYIFNYGTVVFANYDEIETSKFLSFIEPYLKNKIKEEYKEEILVKNDKKTIFNCDSINISKKISPDIIRTIMLNISQSVLLDFYSFLTQELSSSTSVLINDLEKHGKLKVKEKELMKFIGKTLNIKKCIIDNLYIFESPDIVWDSSYLDLINNETSKLFDITNRFKEIEYTLKTIETSLNVFIELLQNKTSHKLEWIIIILIGFEILYAIGSYFFV